MYFDLIKSNLRSIHLRTKMLEICEWDEDILNDQMKIASQYFENFDPPKNLSWEEVKQHCFDHMKNILEESLAHIIIEVLEHNKIEIQSLMQLEEN